MWIRKTDLVRNISIILLLAVLVSGCKKAALYHNLTEGEANEIIDVLYSAKIDAEKQQEVVQNEISWNVVVNPKQLSDARHILIDKNLPRKKELGLSGVYKEKGLIPTPDEQKARFLLAMKGEIVNSLIKIPEVVDADVVINVPTPEEFASGDEKKPAASVIIRIMPEPNIISQITESKLQQFVANAIENLNPRDVSVIISYVSPPSEETKTGSALILPGTPPKTAPELAKDAAVVIAGVSVSKESAGRLKVYLFIFFAILVILSAVLIVNVVRTTRMKQEYKTLSEGVQRPLIEGEVAEPRPRLGPGEGE